MAASTFTKMLSKHWRNFTCTMLIKLHRKNYFIQFLYKIFTLCIHNVLSTGADNAKIWLIGDVKFGIYCGQMRHPRFPYRGLFCSLKPSKWNEPTTEREQIKYSNWHFLWTCHWTFLVNLSLSTGSVPDEWKKARVVPLYKSGGRENMDNYRPISILPVLSKILEKAVNFQLQQYLRSLIFWVQLNQDLGNIIQRKVR